MVLLILWQISYGSFQPACFILYNYSVWTCSGRFLMLLLDLWEDVQPSCSWCSTINLAPVQSVVTGERTWIWVHHWWQWNLCSSPSSCSCGSTEGGGVCLEHSCMWVTGLRSVEIKLEMLSRIYCLWGGQSRVWRLPTSGDRTGRGCWRRTTIMLL